VKSGKLDGYLGNKTIDWLRSQPDYKIAKQSTVYKTAIMIYNPNNKKIKRVMKRFWSVYSQEILGWRDQPFFSYFLSSEKLTPLILKKEDVFRPVDLKFRGFGDHNYTICDIAKNDTKMLQTAKTFDVPWSKWMENNVLNQKNDQRMQTLLADKLLVKEWLEAKRPNLLSKMKIPKTYWNTTDVDTITLKNLPSSYVLKSNHASGTVIPVKDGIDLTSKQKINENGFKKTAKRWMQMIWGEWGELWYTNIKPCIFAEEFIEMTDGSGGVPIDYKLHVIHSQVVLIQVSMSRFSNPEQQYYNREFDRLDMVWSMARQRKTYNKSSPSIPKPASINDMIYIAEHTSINIPYVRVDLYELHGDLYFSEFTFASGAGKRISTPKYVEHILGYMLAHKEIIPMLKNFSDLIQ